MSYCKHCSLNESDTFIPEYYYLSVFRLKHKYIYVDELVNNIDKGFKRVATISHPYYIYSNGFNIILDSHRTDNDLEDLMVISYKVKKYIEKTKGIKTNVIVNRTRVYDNAEMYGQSPEMYEHQHAWLIPENMSLFIDLICRKETHKYTKGTFPDAKRMKMSLSEYNKKYRNNRMWRKQGYEYIVTTLPRIKKHSLIPSAEDNTITINKNILKCKFLKDMEGYVRNQISFYIFCKDNSTCISSSKNVRININEDDNTLNYKMIDDTEDKCGSDYESQTSSDSSSHTGTTE
jgi:hypothetical protein